MIYVSSSCVKHKKIGDSVKELVANSFKNIELSGGSDYYDGFEEELLELKEKYGLNFLCHNYFPPPKEHFVLNLASLNDEIYEKTFNHLVKTIKLSKKLGAKKFGFHAGFFVDIKVGELGEKISKENLFDKQKSIQRFCEGFKELQNIAKGLELYIENNVFSFTNAKIYENENLFMLTNREEYKKLKEMINFNLLLDVAHLKVSSNTLGLSFEDEFESVIRESNYIHISDNNSLHDLNYRLQKDSKLVEMLRRNDLKNKDFTLEIYDSMDAIKESSKILHEVMQ